MNKTPVCTGRNKHNKTTVDSDFLVKAIIVYFLVGKRFWKRSITGYFVRDAPGVGGLWKKKRSIVIFDFCCIIDINSHFKKFKITPLRYFAVPAPLR